VARIRSLKPEFWADEKMSPLDPLSRLVYLGLISLADDAGRLLDNVKILDAMIFPETDDSCREALATLSRIGRIGRGKTDSGQRVIQIVKWKEHQKVDHPNYAACLPAIIPSTCENPDILQALESLARDWRAIRERLATLPTTYDLRSTTNDQRSKEGAASAPPDPPRRPKKSSIVFRKPTVDDVRAYCVERGNSVDAEQFVNFYESKGWRVGNAAMKDWKACVITWEKRDRSPPPRPTIPLGRPLSDADKFIAEAKAKMEAQGK
jgi:hypothetical protein